MEEEHLSHEAKHIDQFLLNHSARDDNWREITTLGDAWAATDVPDLPNFSCFHEVFCGDAGRTTPEGDMHTAFFGAYDPSVCEYVPSLARSATVGWAKDRRWSRRISSSPIPLGS